MSQHFRRAFLFSIALASLVLTSCRTPPGKPLARTGDEIVVAGHLFHTGTRVVTWMDPHGYDAYRVERRFSPFADSSWEKTKETVKTLGTPNRYGMRRAGLSEAEVEQVRGGGWELAQLQSNVDQFVLHFDVCGISKACFNVLHDHRGLSVHFMLDLDGTIYQTLDLKERAWHATISNDRSVGIEIANMGAYASTDMKALNEWYQRDASGRVFVKVPERLGDPMFQVKNFVGHPARPDLIRGNVQGENLQQYDYTPEQYAALTKLTAALCKIFPKIRCDYPRDASGQLVLKKLPDDELKKYAGVIGHYHIQTNKTDPGPALQWDKLINGARAELGLMSLKPGAEGK